MGYERLLPQMVMSPATKVARRASGRARHRARANSRLPRLEHQFMGFPWDFHGILGGCLFFSQDCIGFFLGDFSIDFLSFLRDFTGFLASWAPIATWGSGNEGHCWQRSLCRKFGTQEYPNRSWLVVPLKQNAHVESSISQFFGCSRWTYLNPPTGN